MEKLSHLIQEKIAQNRWKPVYASKGGPGISHIFFADDLVLFSQASRGQVEMITRVLEDFSMWSGQTISYQKSKIYISDNTPRRVASELCRISGIPRTRDLGKYLGVPLLHGRVTKKTYWHLVEKVQSRLASWKINQLSLAGRMVLIQSASSPIPNYTMQTTKLPLAVCDQIDKLNRSFLWGSSVNKRRVHLMNWEKVCSPRSKGGLGIKRAREMNLAFLAKMGWRLQSSNEYLWQVMLKEKYKRNEQQNHSLKRRSLSYTWKSISYGFEVLEKGMRWRVGDGEHINFWHDKWLDNKESLAQILHLPSNDALDNLRVKDFIDDDGWRMRKICEYLPQGLAQKVKCIPVKPLTRLPDKTIWSLTPTGNFSTKSAYQSLTESPNSLNSWEKQIWKLDVQPKVQMFMWLAFHNRILCNENRKFRKLTDNASCSFCGAEFESTIHVLRDCPNTKNLWNMFMIDTRFDGSWNLSLED